MSSSPAPLPGLIPLGFILGGNLLPLFGVLFWGWDIFSIFALYWLENILLGVFMIMKLLFSGLENAADFAARLFLAAFFILHYGLFMIGHGVFVFSLFGPSGFVSDGLIPDFWGVLNDQQIKGLAIALLGIGMAELFQVFTPAPEQEKSGRKGGFAFLAVPYGRLVVLHLTLIFGGMLTLGLGSPVWGLALLVGLKIAFELGLFALTRRGLMFPFRRMDDKEPV